MPVQALACKECGTEYELEARYVCERCFGPLEVRYEYGTLDADSVKRRIQAGPQNLWRYSDFLPFSSQPRYALPAGCTPLVRAPRLAEALGLREVWVKNDAANPTHSFKDRVVSVALAKARELGYETVACASTGNLANAVAAHAAAAGLDSYVFIPADLEEQKILATGVYGTKLVTVRGNYDDVNRLCTELSADRDWAFVNVNVRPYYAEGSKTLAYEIAEELGFELPDRVVAPIASGSLFTKIARGFDEWREVGLVEGETPTMNGAQADGCSPVAQRVRGRLGRLQAGEAGHDRQVARDRQPGRRSLRARARAAQRRHDRLGQRRGDPRRHQAARRDHRHLHRDGRRGDHGDAGEAGRARRHRSGRARGRRHHRRGPQDARRGAGHVRDARDRRERRLVRLRAARRRGCLVLPARMAVTVKIPTQLRSVTGGEGETTVDGASTVGEVLDGLYDRFDGLRDRIAEDGDLRRFVNVYVGGEDIRFLDGLDTSVEDGDEVTILPAVAGGS